MGDLKLTDEVKTGARRHYDPVCYAALTGERSLALDWLEKSGATGQRLRNSVLPCTQRALDLNSRQNSLHFRIVVQVID